MTKTVAAAGDSAWRKSHGGDLRLAVYLAGLLAQAPKDRDTDILECNDYEAAPDGRTFEVEERERGTLRDFYLATADGFLQQAADDPRIGRDWFALKEQFGIDFAGEPLLRPVKCVVHDVSENLMCRKR